MNVLTKIFIVVLVVLALFASFVFISLTTAVPNWRTAYEGEKLGRLTANMQANQKELALQRVNQDLATALSGRTNAEQELQKAKTDLEAKLLTERGNVQALTQQVNQQQVSLASLANDIKVNTERNNQLVQALAAAQKDGDKLAEELRLTIERSRVDQASLGRQAVMVERLTEQNAELTRRLEEAQRVGGPAAAAVTAMPGEFAPAGPEAPKVSGTVTAVRNDIAEVNIGSANGLKKGDKLTIYRGMDFVGYLRVELVDANSSAGTILERTSDPRQGDKVTNKLAE